MRFPLAVRDVAKRVVIVPRVVFAAHVKAKLGGDSVHHISSQNGNLGTIVMRVIAQLPVQG
jgi:hypothetical protein